VIEKQKRLGFTIVELIVVIVVIGILAAITLFAVSGWRTRTAITEVKNDLTNAQSTLSNYRNYNGTYPSSVASVYTSTSTVTLTYTLRGDGTYCLNAVSIPVTSVAWYIDSRAGGGVTQGSCTP
jgi:prepilin-type N-terminal cleavage/methylation domain-containing protein